VNSKLKLYLSARQKCTDWFGAFFCPLVTMAQPPLPE
ncbi:MAG: hypothetical protein ACI822_002539, partial [Gammaproteobacteria bacterium]